MKPGQLAISCAHETGIVCLLGAPAQERAADIGWWVSEGVCLKLGGYDGPRLYACVCAWVCICRQVAVWVDLV